MAQDLELALRIRADLQQAVREVRGLRGDIRQFGQGAESSARRVDRLATSGERVGAAFRQLRGVIAGVGFGLLAREVIRADDAYTRLRGRLSLVTRDAQQLQRVERQLFDSAQRTRTAYEGTVELYARVAQNSEQLGLTQEQLLQITEATNQAIQISGASAQEAQAGVIQFAQALASGELRGDELRSVLEQLPRLATAIGAGLREMGLVAEGTIGEIRDLAEEGQLTADVVIQALLSQTGQLEEEFSQLDRTVGQAMTQLRNDLQRASAAGDLSPLADSIDEVREIVSDPTFVDGLGTVITAFARLAGVAARAADALGETGEALGEGFAQLIEGRTIADEVEHLEQRLENLRAQRENVPEGFWANFFDVEALDQAIAEAEARLEELRTLQQGLAGGGDESTGATRLPVDLAFPELADPGPLLPRGRAGDERPVDPEAIEDAREALAALNADLQEQVATFGASDAAALEYRLTLGDLADEVRALGPEGERLREQLIGQAQALERLQQREAAAAEARREREQLEQAGARLTERLRTAQETYNAELARYRELLDAGAISQTTFNRAVNDAKTRLEEAQKATDDAGEEMSQFAIQAARNMQTAFADFLFEPFEDGLEGMVRSFADAMRRMLAEALAAAAIEAAINAFTGGGGGGGGGGFQGVAAAIPAALRHTGGLADEGGPSRRVSPALFAGAPRYRTGGIAGLAADEVPAILHRGEEVLTEADPRHRDNRGEAGGPAGVRIVNAVSDADIAEAMSSPAGERVVLNIIRRHRGAVREELI